MTEKQMLKLVGKEVAFDFRETPYSIKKEECFGRVLAEKIIVNLVRDNKLKGYEHYDMHLVQTDDEGKEHVVRTIEWNKLKNISNLVVISE